MFLLAKIFKGIADLFLTNLQRKATQDEINKRKAQQAIFEANNPRVRPPRGYDTSVK